MPLGVFMDMNTLIQTGNWYNFHVRWCYQCKMFVYCCTVERKVDSAVCGLGS